MYWLKSCSYYVGEIDYSKVKKEESFDSLFGSSNSSPQQWDIVTDSSSRFQDDEDDDETDSGIDQTSSAAVVDDKLSLLVRLQAADGHFRYLSNYFLMIIVLRGPLINTLHS